MFRFGDAMSIFARSVREPSGNSPFFMRSNRSRFSSTERFAIRALLARLGQRAAILANLIRGEIADVSLARLDQLDGPLIELAEIVGGVEERRPIRSPASARLP